MHASQNRRDLEGIFRAVLQNTAYPKHAASGESQASHAGWPNATMNQDNTTLIIHLMVLELFPFPHRLIKAKDRP